MAASDQPGVFSQSDLVAILNRQTEAGNALVAAGLIEDWLEKLLITGGKSLESDDVNRIFGRGGPLSNFAGKIEIAYMFGLIDKGVRNDLRRIKNHSQRVRAHHEICFLSD